MEDVISVKLVCADRDFSYRLCEGIWALLIRMDYGFEDMFQKAVTRVLGIEDSNGGDGAWEGGIGVDQLY